jgi:4-hydroxy-3-methylbut-2-enyl diphosphate reductase
MQIRLANPRGFCAGVDRAIDIVNRSLDLFGPPVYVRHEVVHNRYVVDQLKEKGAIFVEELDEVPDNNLVIFSAHGVSRAVQEEAARRGLQVLDATCPLVTKVHVEVIRYAREGREAILVGHAGHPEVEGTIGQYDTSRGGCIYLIQNLEDVANLKVKNPDRLTYVTQTTLSVDDTAAIIDALKQRFPNIAGPRREDICYATTNRQDAVRQLALECGLVIVVGSPNSSNSNRLRELAERCGASSWLIDDPTQIQASWLVGHDRIGVTAGASAPEELVQMVVKRLHELGCDDSAELVGRKEDMHFALPRELR